MAQGLQSQNDSSAQNLASSDLFSCLQLLEAAGPLRIPPRIHGEEQTMAAREVWGQIPGKDQYQAWAGSNQSGVLHIFGSPDSDTSDMTAFLVEDLRRRIQPSSKTSIACFFCDNQDQAVDSPAAIVRSLLCQLLLQRSDVYECIRQEFEDGAEGQRFEDHIEDFSGLWRSFYDMMHDERLGLVFIVVDGLDKCPALTRSSLLPAIRDLVDCISAQSGVAIKFLITYTQHTDDGDEQSNQVGVVLDLGKRIDTTEGETRHDGAATSVKSTDHGANSQLHGSHIPFAGRDMAVLSLLLDKGADMLSKDERHGRTPLSWAAGNGKRSMVKMLVDRGVDVESEDRFRRTSLSWAAEKSQRAVAELLVGHGANIDAKDKYGHTPLLYASKSGHEGIVLLLLANGACVHRKTVNNRTALSFAAANGHLSIIRALISRGADTDCADIGYRRTPLSRAAEKGHTSICKLLCERGVEVDSKDIHDRTPLLWASGNGHDGAVQQLLHHGASTSSRDSLCGQTPLIWACRDGNQASIRLLLLGGADINARDKRGRSPLSWAAGNGNVGAMRLLLDHGADPNSRDWTGRTPLSWAAGNEQADTVYELLNCNSKVFYADRYGRTPLAWASDNALGSIVLMLQRYFS